MNRSTIGAAALIGALLLAAPAAAHITATPAEAPADSFATLGFSVGHGCEDSPTTRVRIQVPPSVPSVTPQRTPFWNISTKEGDKDPVELHGEEITRGTSEVTFTAKQPLDPHQLDVLSLSVKLPAGDAGETIYFPTIQECAEGRTGWIQIPAAGESADELESPAPAVVLTAAGGGHGSSAAQEPASSGDEPVSSDGTEPATGDAPAEPALAAAEADAGDDGAPVWLAVAALVVGALGLLAAIGALLTGRRAARGGATG
jgi:periplasmic copper chaperone A